jgi:pimeloyl-ACP methyl ester carboxylesterase
MENVTCPVLIIRGKESSFLSWEISQQICRALNKSEFKEIPESTHMPVQENPIASTKVIADFLNN